MARTDWLRTFVAIYRTGSVSDGARARHLSQPAASQQLTALERNVGGPLFVRGPGGVTPTRQARDLYATVADALDRIEGVLDGLDAGAVRLPPARLQLGASAECFAGVLLSRLAAFPFAVDATFGPDAELLDRLGRAELDVAVTTATTAKRAAVATAIGHKSFVLVAAPDLAPARRFRSLHRLGEWLTGRPWVSYSAELPLTRRFWQDALGRPFAAELRLVAPDLRVVAAAVERGLGTSLLPRFACEEPLRAGRVVEVHPVAGLVPPEPWYASVRPGDLERPAIRAVLDALRAPPDEPP
jgi:DNA-binding transcriptional LysR family regulator